MWLSPTIVTHLAMQCGSRLQSAHIWSCNATTRWAHLTHNENSSALWNSQQTKSTTVIHFQRITAQGQTKQLLTRMNLSIQFASWSVDTSAVAPPSPAQTSHKVTRVSWTKMAWTKMAMAHTNTHKRHTQTHIKAHRSISIRWRNLIDKGSKTRLFLAQFETCRTTNRKQQFFS